MRKPSRRSAKIRQWFRCAVGVLVSQSIAPIRDPLGRLQIISIPFFLLVVFLALGREQVMEEATLEWAALQALIYALPVFLIWNVFLAIFGANKKIAEKGIWVDDRFIYHTPLHICTVQFGPHDNGDQKTIIVADAEPNTFVQFRFDYFGGRGVVQAGSLLVNPELISRKTNFGTRLGKQRDTTIVFNIPDNSDLTTLRIYAEWWGP